MGIYLPSAISLDISIHSSPLKAYNLTVTASSVADSPRSICAPIIASSSPKPTVLAYSPSTISLTDSTKVNLVLATPYLSPIARALTVYSPITDTAT